MTATTRNTDQLETLFAQLFKDHYWVDIETAYFRAKGKAAKVQSETCELAALGLSNRVYGALHRAGITTLKDATYIANNWPTVHCEIRGFGHQGWHELRSKLREWQVRVK
jgi:hypothetical protein